MRRTWLLFGGIGGLIVIGAVVYRPAASASTPRVPASDSEVLAQLPAARRDPNEAARVKLRDALAANPHDLSTALALARVDVEASRSRGDPRFLGYAQAALAPWWDLPDPPTEVAVLRATIRQSQHDFTGALADLDRVTKDAPANAQAWLTRAVVLTVVGRYDDARASCGPLERLAPALVVAVCNAQVDSVTGSAKAAYDRLAATLAGAPPELRDWALTALGDIAMRLGRDADAERHYRDALAIDPADPYAIGALADLLLDTNRAADAARLVEGLTDNDGLLLRLALAEKTTNSPNATADADKLAARHDASRLRGDVVHRREQARFELGVRGDAKAALALAVANWSVQREPWDARVVLESALAAKDPGAAKPVIDFLEKSHLEDPRIAKLVTDIARIH